MTKIVEPSESSEVPTRPSIGIFRRQLTRRPFSRKRMRRRGTAELIVLDLGEDVSSIWSPAAGVRSEPSRVAVDASGEIRGFGFDADLLASEPRHGLTAIGLFDTHPWRDRHVRSLLSWLIERSGVAVRGGAPVFLPLSPNWSPAVHDVVRQAVEDLGGDALVIHRPLAAAVALDLAVEEPICHLVAEISEAHVDLAIIQAGSVVQSQLLPRHDDALIRLATNEGLRALDPDDEMEVRAKGVYLHGWSAPRHAAAAIAAIDLPLAAPVGPGPAVLNGARVLAEAALPWLRDGR